MFSVGSFQEGLKEVWKSDDDDDDQMMKKIFTSVWNEELVE